MKYIFKNSGFYFLLLLLFSCESSNKITISKMDGSPSFENAKILKVETSRIDNQFTFSFDIDNYELGVQTSNEFDYKLANSDKGQHIHFIEDNGPYSAHYSKTFSKDIEDGTVVLAFLSRSYHESVKNPNAFILAQVGENQNMDLSNEFLFYSRPKGTYKGEDTKRILLDFYLVNTKISANGNKVKATIQDSEFIIDEWAPYYIEGLPKGEISIKLELINSNGDLIDSPFNPSTRSIILE
mgnify:FL=1